MASMAAVAAEAAVEELEALAVEPVAVEASVARQLASVPAVVGALLLAVRRASLEAALWPEAGPVVQVASVAASVGEVLAVRVAAAAVAESIRRTITISSCSSAAVAAAVRAADRRMGGPRTHRWAVLVAVAPVSVVRVAEAAVAMMRFSHGKWRQIGDRSWEGML